MISTIETHDDGASRPRRCVSVPLVAIRRGDVASMVATKTTPTEGNTMRRPDGVSRHDWHHTLIDERVAAWRSTPRRSGLCGDCNNGLGLFADDVDRLAAAIEYLNQHRNTTPKEK